MGYLRKLFGGDAVSCGPGKVGVISEGERDAFWPWKLHKERALSLANGRWVWGWQTWCLLWAECATWRSVAQGREIKVERLFAAILKRVLGASLRILKLSFMQRR